MLMRSGRFGGFGLDRMLIDYEAVPDAPIDAAPAADPAPADAAPAGEAVDTGQPVDPPAVEPSYLTADEANELFEARWAAAEAQRQAQYQQQSQQQPQPQGPQVDPNEFLDPMNDNFGANLVQFNQERDQFLLGQVAEMLDQRFGPIRQQYEQQQMQQGEQDLTSAFEGHGITGDAVGVATTLARTYYAELTRQYGETEYAANTAIAKAAQAVRGLGGTPAPSQADQLNAIANATASPGGGGVVLNMPAPADNPRAVLERLFPAS